MSDARCTCEPGSVENGWHETRCDDCLRAEIEAFGRVYAWIRGNRLVREADDE